MKSGFVSLIGRPNVGKSTILNLLTSLNLSIVTSKAQTTRNNILGVIDDKDYQIVLVDTPGLHKASNALGISMNKKVFEAVNGSDVNVLIINGKEAIDKPTLMPFLKYQIDIVVLNKIDLLRLPEVNNAKEKIKEFFPKATLIEMCALDGFNKELLIVEMLRRLKEGPKYYPDVNVLKDDVFYVKEHLREKILLLLKEEVPHNIAIYVKEIKHKKESMLINADIYVNKDSQKGIVIGKKGAMLTRIGFKARKDFEEYFHKRVYLSLHVKVKEDWINQNKSLKEFGY